MVRMISGILFIISACIWMRFSGVSERKSKKKVSRNCFIVGVILLIVGIPFFYFGSCKIEMRRRLNEPIISDAQLYGYKILNFSSSYDTSKGMRYFIDIKDTISINYRITLKKVEVTEKFHLKKGYLFSPDEPNASSNN